MDQYITSQQAVKDYVELGAKYSGTGNSVTAFKNAWKQNLEDQGVIQSVNEDAILPTKIVSDIQVAIDASPEFAALKLTFNVEAGTVWIDNENETGALGHKRLAEKKVQVQALDPRNMVPAAIYKLQELDHMTYLKGGALVKYVMDELPRYVMKRVAQAVLVGGVVDESGAAFTAIKAIKGDSLALTTTIAAAATPKDIAKSILTDKTRVKGSDKVLFIAPGVIADIQTSGDAILAAAVMGSTPNFGFSTVVESDILADAGVSYIVLDRDAYLLGLTGSGIETLSDFVINHNSQMIESRLYAWGTLRKVNGAVVATQAAA